MTIHARGQRLCSHRDRLAGAIRASPWISRCCMVRRLLVWQDWRAPLRDEARGHGMGNYRILTVLVLATFGVLYYVFR